MARMLAKELNLGRHLPDLSDASFQIPLSADYSGDYLLAVDGGDFFQGADTTLSTPAPPRIAQEPLTLSQLTPRPPEETISVPPRSSPSSEPNLSSADSNAEIETKGGARRSDGDDSVGDRLVATKPKPRTKVPPGKCTTDVWSGSSRATGCPEVCKRQASSLTSKTSARVQKNASDSSAQAKKHRPRTSRSSDRTQYKVSQSSNKRGAITGGISKTRHENYKPTLTWSAASTQNSGAAGQRVNQPLNSLTLGINPLSKLNPDRPLEIESSNFDSSASSAVVDRILNYSQRLISSIGFLGSEGNPAPSGTQQYSAIDDFRQAASSGSPNPRQGDSSDDPLTLSEISPVKNADLSETDSRQASKRPRSTVPSEGARKKRKPSSDISPGSSRLLRLNVDVGAVTITRAPPPRLKYALKPATHQTSGRGSLGLSKQRSSRTSRRARGGFQGTSANSRVNSGRVPPYLGQSDARPPSASLTKPVEFKFSSDARVESRRAETETEKAAPGCRKASVSHHVPDFRAIHAAHEAELAQRRVRIAPLVPVPIKFCTDERAKEREKFDERIKEKEREIAKEKERARLEREAEEERLVREFRKKAVPKANEVPEWYKEAPRKKGNDLGSGGV